VTKEALETELLNLRNRMLRTEIWCESLRRRNGELMCQLAEHVPDVAKRFVNEGGHPTRYVILDRIVERATQLALKASGFPEVIDEELDALVEAVMANEGYWRRIEEEREQRKNQAARAAQTKREKEAANGH
jgi:hypothetical protein